MQNLNLTLVQPNQIWEDVSQNLANYERLLAQVPNTDLILLPELFQTSFTMNTSLAEQMSGKSMQWLLKCAKHHNSAIYTSLMIEEAGKYYNRGVFVHQDGLVECYDKRKTFGLAKEGDSFSSGTSEQIANYLGWNIQLQICYDLRFPELVRNRITETGNAAYDVIIYVANWPEKRSSHWKTLLKARAIENQCFVVGVNRVGQDGNGFSYSGDSVVVDASGNETKLTPNQEEVKSVVIKKSDLTEFREMLPFLKDR